MSYLGYFKTSAKLYENIYTQLMAMSSLPNNISNVQEIKENIEATYNSFKNIQTRFCDLMNDSIVSKVIIEPSSWESMKLVNVYNHSHVYLTFNISFYVDNPQLNEYGIIIEEHGMQKHYKFREDSSNETEHIIHIAPDIKLCFTDKILNYIRNGEISSKGRVKISYDSNKYSLLRVPFHNKRIYIEDFEWVYSVLNDMDYEMKLIKQRQKKHISKNNIFSSTETKTLFS